MLVLALLAPQCHPPRSRRPSPVARNEWRRDRVRRRCNTGRAPPLRSVAIQFPKPRLAYEHPRRSQESPRNGSSRRAAMRAQWSDRRRFRQRSGRPWSVGIRRSSTHFARRRCNTPRVPAPRSRQRKTKSVSAMPLAPLRWSHQAPPRVESSAAPQPHPPSSRPWCVGIRRSYSPHVRRSRSTPPARARPRSLAPPCS